jgi:hypothetical protein
MAKQVINTGTAANAKNGDPLRTAFTKINANFTELYAGGANEAQLTNGSKTVTLGTDGNITLPDGGKINTYTSDGSVEIQAGGLGGGSAGLVNHNYNNQVQVDDTGVYVMTNVLGLPHNFIFGTNGGLTFPDTTVQTTAYTGTSGITWPVRSFGSVLGSGTVTIDYSTDRLVRATATGTSCTIAHSNITAGKIVDLVISNTSGASCTVTYGVPASNTIGNTTTFAIGNGTTHVFTIRSFGTTTTDVYVTVV